MFLWLALAILLLLLILLLHCNEHFTIQCCPTRLIFTNTQIQHRKSSSQATTGRRSSSIPYSPGFKTRFCCILTSIDHETLKFYPSSFALYIIFIIILTLTVIAIQLLNHFYNGSHLVTESLYGFQFSSSHQHSISSVYTTHRFRFSDSSERSVIVFVLDYILVFGIMILAVWESLFTFYRYYTLFKGKEYLQLISAKTVLQTFMLYPIIFCVLFALQIYIYYWLWPLIILLHCIFNGYFCYKFVSLLINSYKVMDQMNRGARADDANKKLLSSVYIMRRTSFISATIQCIYLSLFVITYNMNTVYYLPLLWAISCSIFAFNFARNRTAIHEIIIRLSKVCDYNDVQPDLEENANNKTGNHDKEEKIRVLITECVAENDTNKSEPHPYLSDAPPTPDSPECKTTFDAPSSTADTAVKENTHTLKDVEDELSEVSDDNINLNIIYGSDNEMNQEPSFSPDVEDESVSKEAKTDHVPSNESECIKTNDNEEDYAEALRKLNVLAAIGFCSAKDLNSFAPKMHKTQSAPDGYLKVKKNTSTVIQQPLSVGFVPKILSFVKFKPQKKHTTSDVIRGRSDNECTVKNKAKDRTMDIRKSRSAGATRNQKKKVAFV